MKQKRNMTVSSTHAATLLTLFLKLTSGSEVNFKAEWFPPDLWTKTGTMPKAKVYGTGPKACSMACLLHQRDDLESCQAFRITDSKECEFGKLSYGQVLPKAATAAKTRIWYNRNFYTKEQVTHVYTVGQTVSTYDPIDTTRDPPLDVPMPGGDILRNQPIIINYRTTGLLTVGGGADNNHTVTRSWHPGDIEWETLASASFPHRYGVGLALGQSVMVACGRDENNARTKNVELLERGAWQTLAEYPEPVEQLAMMARDSDLVYGIGGNINGSPGQSPHVFRYSRQTNAWTPMPDMPNGRVGPSCGRVTLRSRDSIVCSGSRHDSGDHMDVFDLDTETWSTLSNVRAAEPVTFASIMITVGNRLFRVRGQAEDQSFPSTLNVFDADKETWETPVQLEPSTINSNRLARLTVPVIIPKE